ncbi:T6SS immunity protein Tli4 family protein [Massilia phosphatilytica]
MFYRSLSSALVTAVCAALGACTALPNNTSRNANGAPSSTTSTFCMGRFLIDVPAGSSLTGGNYKYDFISIEPVMDMTPEAFENEVRTREWALRSAKHKDTKRSMLLQSAQLNGSTRTLASWKAEYSTDVINVAGYRWINGRRFLFQLDVGDDRQKPGVNRMRDALSRLRTRIDTDIPTDPGYCFAGGFIANPAWKNEEAGVDFRIAGHPDTLLSVWFYPLSRYKHDRPLLERMGGTVQFLGNLVTSVRVLRRGDRQVGPYQGQEHLASAPGSNGMRGHAFVWETQGDGTLDTPAIKIELTTGYRDGKGNQQKTSLTDKEAIKLWDDVLDSFRLRPVRDPAPTAQ